MDDTQRGNNLFSIDIEAYLHKAAVFSQRSSLLYTAELTKTAMKRGAGKVSILLDQKKVELTDDGKGIDPAELNMLADLKKTVPVERKEAAIRTLRGVRSAGLLAVFAPEPRSIFIETVFNGIRFSLKIDRNGVMLDEGCSISGGTRIRLERKSRDLNRELKILREYVKWSGKEIVLNGMEIGRDQSIPDTLASMNIGAAGPVLKGICGIPAVGGMCRIWFTENGILSKKTDFPPIRGLVFSAVLESELQEAEDVQAGLIPYIHKLYHHLCENYPKVRSDQRDRIEELVFLHTKKTGERLFSDAIKPFRIVNSMSYIGLQELIELSNSGKLFVMNSEVSSPMRPWDAADRTVELTPRQIDFVMNHLRIPARFVDLSGPGRLRFIEKFLIGFQLVLFRIAPGFRLFIRKIDNDQLWNEEKGLISRLTLSFRDDPEFAEKSYHHVSISIVRGFGFSPLYSRTSGPGPDKSELEIYLRRGSRSVRKIVKLNDADGRNIELIMDLIKAELRARSVI